MFQPGDMLGGFELLRPLGEGPFGVVWLASDVNGTPAALKLLKPAFVKRHAGQAAFNRLLSSIRVHQQLRHDGLAAVFGPIEDAERGALGMVTEYVEGRPMGRVRLPERARHGQDPRALAALLRWFEQTVDVLAWLHAQGVVHGNLKPSNAMLVRRQTGHQLKVLDLPWSAIGLAAPPPGQPTYLAPEQVQGGAPSPSSDQWSLGTLLCRIVTAGDEQAGLAGFPTGLVVALQRATQVAPEARYRSVAELGLALREVRLELEQTLPAGGAGTPLPMIGSVAPDSAPPRPGADVQPAETVPNPVFAGPGAAGSPGAFPPGGYPPGSYPPASPGGYPPQGYPGYGPPAPGYPPQGYPVYPGQAGYPAGAYPPSAGYPQGYPQNFPGMPPTAPPTPPPVAGVDPSRGPHRGDTPEPGLTMRRTRGESMPPLPEARRIPDATTDGGGSDSLETPMLRHSVDLAIGGDQQLEGSSIEAAMPDEPQLGFDGVTALDDGPTVETRAAEGDVDTSPPSTPTRRRWTVLVGALVMFVVGALLVTGLKLAGIDLPLRKPRAQSPQGALPPGAGLGLPEEEPPEGAAPSEAPAEDPTGTQASADAGRAPEVEDAPEAPPEPKAGRTKENGRAKEKGRAATPPPAKQAAPSPPKKKAPARKAPDDDANLDAALERLAGGGVKKAREQAVACDEGDAEACAEVARRKQKRGDAEGARAAFDRACSYGSVGGCYEAGRLWAKPKGDVATAIERYEAACTRNHRRACEAAAGLLALGGDAAKSRVLRQKACTLGLEAACRKLEESAAPEEAAPRGAEGAGAPEADTGDAPAKKEAATSTASG